MTILYEDIAKKKKLLTRKRILKYNKWVEDAEKARNISHSLGAKENQYDKAEDLITFYTFALLEHEKVPEEIKLKVVQEILSFIGVNETVKEAKLSFERGLPPPLGYLEWLSTEVMNYPIRYIREQAEERNKSQKKLEGDTQVDAMIETDNFLILIEVKFTSDISPYTKFGLIRNQIARLIDVGISEVQRHHKGKKLIVLCCTPFELFQKRSRFYFYKIQEYSETVNIKNDIPWCALDEINITLKKIAWISLEKVIEIVYQNTKRYLNSEEFEEAEKFFRERRLWFST
jgi:hypothetical protein